MPTEIHDAAARGYQTAPDSYQRGRPDYPDEAVQKLISELKIGSGRTVLDLAAGTGKFTRCLTPSGAELSAVEPVEGMRKKFSALLPDAPILEGTAESIPLPDHSVDTLTVAQAFHWFNGSQALVEIHRVLKTHGSLGLIWNVRDESLDWVARLTEIIDPHEKGAPRYKTGAWRDAFLTTNLFTPLQSAQFHHVQMADPETIVARVESISFISALSDREREEVLEQVRALLMSHPLTRGKAIIEFPYRTDVFWCRKKER